MFDMVFLIFLRFYCNIYWDIEKMTPAMFLIFLSTRRNITILFRFVWHRSLSHDTTWKNRQIKPHLDYLIKKYPRKDCEKPNVLLMLSVVFFFGMLVDMIMRLFHWLESSGLIGFCAIAHAEFDLIYK